VAGAVISLLVVFLAAAGPWASPHRPYALFPSIGGPLPSTWKWDHLCLGTDNVGHDELSPLIAGARVSVEVGGFSTLITFAVGTGVGVAAGHAGGAVDDVLIRLTDVTLVLPFM
jgi:peptide/nickel transport system permease protein